MKLTKGMKKALSLLLTSALVLTGANFSGMKADAEETSSKAVFTALDEQNYDVEVTDNKGSVTVTGDFTGVQNLGFFFKDECTTDFYADVDLVVNETYTFTKVETGLTCAEQWKDALPNVWNATKDQDIATTDGASLYMDSASDRIQLRVGGKATNIKSITYNFTFTNWTAASEPGSEATSSATPGAASGSAATGKPSDAPSEKPAPGQSFEPVDVTPVDGCDYTAEVMYNDPAYNYNTMADKLTADVEAGKATIPNAKIVGNGTYSITLPAEFFKPYLTNPDAEGAEGVNVFNVDIQDILLKDATVDASKMTVKDIMISLDGQLIAVDQDKVLQGDIEEKGTYRLEFYNIYGATKNAPPIDVENFKWKKEMKITFTVEGLAAKSGSVESPAPSASVQPTAPATGTSTTGTSATGTAASGTAATKKLTVAKKSVVVAAGKSVKVKYTVTKTAAASKAAAVTVKSANKKIAKVSKVSGKKQIKISVPKKATKGASTKITLKSGNKTAKVTVKVQNKVKKVKAAKKTLTVKKGKKAKATFKVTAANKKKATTDKVTVKFSKKVAKKVKTAVKKGKVIVTVKGLKKGKSAKMTVKVGKKSAKMTVKVK